MTAATTLALFDTLTDREFGFLASLVHPAGITREEYREELRTGGLDSSTFRANLQTVRAMAPRAWGLRAVQ